MVNTLLYVSYLLIYISSNCLTLLYTKKLVRTTKKMNFLTIFLAKYTIIIVQYENFNLKKFFLQDEKLPFSWKP